MLEISHWMMLHHQADQLTLIETLIENNQHTMREIADILKICKSINLLVKMKNVSFILLKKRREKNINVWLPLAHPLLGTWPTTQACTLTVNQTSNPFVQRPVLNPLSYASSAGQGLFQLLEAVYIPCLVASSFIFKANNVASSKSPFPFFHPLASPFPSVSRVTFPSLFN